MVVSTVILQAAPSLIKERVPFKVGFTTTKKLGKAHVRNRARRRLRAVVCEVFEHLALDNVEYVLIGRYNTATCPYKDLKNDVKWALKKANAMIEKGIYQSPLPEKKEKHTNEDTADFSC